MIEPRIQRVFETAENLSRKDNGRLWGKKLYRRLLIVNPQDRSVTANTQNARGTLTGDNGFFRGFLEENVPVANTAQQWHGETWVMLMENSLNRPEAEIRRLAAHEMWHGIQTEIGVPPRLTHNSHLMTLRGRIWMKLEWRALAEALVTGGDAGRNALDHALLFRRKRRELIPEARERENLFETTEGPAEYTGLKLSGLNDTDARKLLAGELIKADEEEMGIWTFPFRTVTAYGLLADELGLQWRRVLKAGTDMADFFPGYVAEKEDHDSLAAAVDSHNGRSLVKRELEHEKVIREKDLRLKRVFSTPPLLHLPLKNFQMSFNSLEMHPLGNMGIVYTGAGVTDNWGKLDVTGDVLVNTGEGLITLKAENIMNHSGTIRGSGWVLKLSGDFVLVESGGNWKPAPLKGT